MNNAHLTETTSDIFVLDSDSEFFAPVSTDVIDGLISKYNQDRNRIAQVADMVSGDLGNIIHYFLDGNKGNSHYSSLSTERIFQADGAIKALNSAYWSRALQLTDVYDCMPQKRRDEWSKSITEMTAPDFIEDSVRPTLQQLLVMRSQFFAERVEGIYRALSHEHLTNNPIGFGKRMIIGYVIRDYGSISHSQAGYINDLRAVIAKFMGRDEPKHWCTGRLIETMKGYWGEWVSIDGGALRMRLYRKGTVHLEIHPDMAWRLNAILASLFPAAIPAQYRTKPKKRAKQIALIQRPLPFAVLDILADSKPKRNEKHVELSFSSRSIAGFAWDEAGRILQGIGGVERKLGRYEFDYCPASVIDEIVMSGCIPDYRSHQYYPTNAVLAQQAVEEADIKPTDECAETSAGQGGIAAYLPIDKTVCIEISPLHCEILRSKGFNTIEADFLEWSKTKTVPMFDKIVMNPPYSDGRAVAHVVASMQLIKPRGRLVAILPSSYINKSFDVVGEWSFSWSSPIENAFTGTSISVAILRANRLN